VLDVHKNDKEHDSRALCSCLQSNLLLELDFELSMVNGIGIQREELLVYEGAHASLGVWFHCGGRGR
jgi:hypothetical protein